MNSNKINTIFHSSKYFANITWITSFLVSYQVVYYFNLVFITNLDSSKYLEDWKQFRCYTFFLAEPHLVLSFDKLIVNVPHPSKRKFLYLHWNDEIKTELYLKLTTNSVLRKRYVEKLTMFYFELFHRLSSHQFHMWSP